MTSPPHRVLLVEGEELPPAGLRLACERLLASLAIEFVELTDDTAGAETDSLVPLTFAADGACLVAGRRHHLTVDDIDDLSPAARALVADLGKALGRPALVERAQMAASDAAALRAWAQRHADDPAAEAFATEEDRLRHDAERAHRIADRARDEVATLSQRIRELEAGELASRLSALAAENQSLRAQIADLHHTLSAARHALAAVPADRRAHVAQARAAAARADALAADIHTSLADAALELAFSGGARYRGALHDDLPHGPGRMTFTRPGGGEIVFAGAFVAGRRNGPGVGDTGDGWLWRGDWRDDQPCGHGVLTTPDGSCFEGEIGLVDGQPRAIEANGHLWPPEQASAAAAIAAARPALAAEKP